MVPVGFKYYRSDFVTPPPNRAPNALRQQAMGLCLAMMPAWCLRRMSGGYEDQSGAGAQDQKQLAGHIGLLWAKDDVRFRYVIPFERTGYK
ncbi:hypothetical protein [uncultured Cohaesibacter sp.]|uniref:hypothetical protein n=1 Tax=uncultured Cohaesibacter sp. TaxID=1002546 RepID=UPI002AAA9F12|nr:hypothetical protein [uncultured Cohaesibacter sp.]